MDEVLTNTANDTLIRRSYHLRLSAAIRFNERAAEDCQRGESASFIMRLLQDAYNAKEIVWTPQGLVYKPKRKRGDVSKRKT